MNTFGMHRQPFRNVTKAAANLQSLIGFEAQRFLQHSHPTGSGYEDRKLPQGENMLLIVLIILLLVFGFGGYRMGPGLGYYGGGGVSLILLIVIVLLLLRVI
jgi:hypothetical protein